MEGGVGEEEGGGVVRGRGQEFGVEGGYEGSVFGGAVSEGWMHSCCCAIKVAEYCWSWLRRCRTCHLLRGFVEAHFSAC